MGSQQPNNSTKVEASPRIRFTKPANGNVVNHGYMSREDAETVYREVLRHWQLSQSTPEQREDLMTSLAEALIQGTSSERDYSQVNFEFDGDDLSLDQLEHLATRYTNAENPMRVWARSFRGGEMAARIAGLLSEPTNSILRERAAYNYGCGLDKASLCFDFSDALIEYGYQLSADERSFIRSARAMKTGDSHVKAQQRGGTRAAPDGSGTLGGVSRDIASASAVPQDMRAKFPSLR